MLLKIVKLVNDFKLPSHTKVHFSIFLSGAFTSMQVLKRPGRGLTKHTGPNQSKYQIIFHKKSPPQDFYYIRSTLVKGNGIAKIESTQPRRGAQICLSNEVYFS